MSAALAAVGSARRIVTSLLPCGIRRGQEDHCAGIGGGAEEPGCRISDPTGKGVDGDGGPEGLAGGAAHEVGEDPPGERSARELLELAAAGLDLLVGQRDRAGAGRTGGRGDTGRVLLRPQPRAVAAVTYCEYPRYNASPARSHSRGSASTRRSRVSATGLEAPQPGLEPETGRLTATTPHSGPAMRGILDPVDRHLRLAALGRGGIAAAAPKLSSLKRACPDLAIDASSSLSGLKKWAEDELTDTRSKLTHSPCAVLVPTG